MNIPVWVHLNKRNSLKALWFSCFFNLFLINYLLRCIKLLCEAGFGVITVSAFVYRANTMSANSLLMYAVPLTFRERSERRHQHTRHNPPWARGSMLFFSVPFFWNIMLLCLTWSPLTVSLLLLSFGSGSYSNPFLHASDRLILSLLSCCSTWRRIMCAGPLLPFRSYLHNLCSLTATYKTKQPGLFHCLQTVAENCISV